MSDASQMPEIGHFQSDPRNADKTWPTNIALLGLGGAILWIAFRFLRWDDPRLLFSPWTYALATPVCLLGLSLVLRQVVSRLVQSSAQVAFLISVIVHLLLLVCALDVVIATRMWPAFFDALAAEKQDLLKHERFQLSGYSRLGLQANPDQARPDYLRYVPTQHDAQAATLSAETRLALARQERAPLVSPDPKWELTVQSVEMERPAPELDLSAVEASAVELSPAEFTQPQPSLTRPATLEVPRTIPQPPALTAADSAMGRARSDDRSAWLQAPKSPEPLSLELKAPPLAQARKLAMADWDTATAVPLSQNDRFNSAAVPQPPLASYRVPLPENMRSTAPDPPLLEPQPAPQQRIGSMRQPVAEGLGVVEPVPMAIDPRAGSVEGMQRRPPVNPVDSRGIGGAMQDLVALPELSRNDLRVAAQLGQSRIEIPQAEGSQGSARAVEPELAPQELPPAKRSQTMAIERPLGLNMEADLGTDSWIPKSSDSSWLARSARAAPTLSVPSLETRRFALDVVGGPLSRDNQALLPAPAFQQRVDRLIDGATTQSGASGPQTEQAIELGLAFLVKHQRSDGSWRLQDLDREILLRSDTAATGLCLLALQGAGYTHKRFQYAEASSRALDFLIKHQLPSGDLYIPQDPASDQNAWLYSHAIATLAICEAYGMTQDESLREPAQLAVDFMVSSQEPERGGWRYRPNVGSDTSVTGWFTMALKSAQLAGLEVPKSTFDRIARYLQVSQASTAQPHLFRYNPYAPDTAEQRHGLKPTHVMTSVGLLMRMYLGWQRELPEMQAGADFLLTQLPETGVPLVAQRDTYYWYYATQVLFHMGGQRWQAWNDRLRPALLDSQVTDGVLAGSWDPNLPTADIWARYGGRLYVTTMNLLSLEVNYRHLPLYEATAR